MNRPFIIYHGDCADGYGAAYAAHFRYPDADFYKGVYQETPPDVTGRDVFMLDFSYKFDVVHDMARSAKSITIIDHHISACKDLCGERQLPHNVFCEFDMDHSGAVMAWIRFNPELPMPTLFDYIQDRDLWRHKLPHTKEVNAAIFSYEYDFGVWEKLLATSIDDLTLEGASILRKQNKDLMELLPKVTRKFSLGSYDVLMANLPYMLASEAGHILAKDAPFGGTYYDTSDGRHFSLRSREGGLDVSKIAAQYGGGGHEHAAGFRVPRGHPLAKQ